jgi:prepilin-type N-terminal cleavage/methylation domain-containing protein
MGEGILTMRTNAGFTLVEVLLALSILLLVMVGLVTTTGKTTHVAVTSDRQEAAIELVQDKVDKIRIDPDYAGLDTLYGTTETSFPSLPGFQRKTVLQRVTTAGNDYKRFTVTVTGPGLPAAGIARTVTVAAP